MSGEQAVDAGASETHAWNTRELLQAGLLADVKVAILLNCDMHHTGSPCGDRPIHTKPSFSCCCNRSLTAALGFANSLSPNQGELIGLGPV